MSWNEQSAPAATPRPEWARSGGAGLLGDFSALLQQIGEPDYFGSFSVPIDTPSANGLLQNYLTGLLVPVELPAIAEACGHGMRCEHRELIAQDQLLTRQINATPFSSASRLMGRSQLARLRPLRDDRVLRRYGEAVDLGQAQGWHTIVYGLTLALYSVPLRQGLFHYARQILAAMAKKAGPQGSDAATLDLLLEQVPAAVEAALARC